MKEVKEILLLNEKGNVRAEVRKLIKEQTVEMLGKNLILPEGCDKHYTKRGTLSIEIGVEKNTREPIYVELEMKVNRTNPDMEKPKAKGKSKEKTKNGKPHTFYKAQG